MGGRGSASGIASAGVTPAQTKMLAEVARRTRNLKNEQYRIINEDGEVVLHKKGNGNAVSATVGEKREHLENAVSIHNHPDGGTFSQDDLNEFGFGAKAMVVATPEGDYTLANKRMGQSNQYEGWLAMRNAMDDAGITRDRSFIEIRNEAQKAPAVKKKMDQMNKTSEAWVNARTAGASQKTLDGLMGKFEKEQAEYRELLQAEQRLVETKPYHDFYKKNAAKYGFSYSFKEKKKSTR